MYRDGKKYDEMDKLAIQLYLDYGFTSFPLDEKDVCRRMGIALVPYSECGSCFYDVIRKTSKCAFYNPLTRWSPPIIFYNDCLSELHSYGCIRQSIFHEIKHYANEDKQETPEDDDLAEHFGRYLMAPTPHLIVNRISNPNEIISQFGTSYTVACNISSNITNRVRKYGTKIFDYELPLIKLLDPFYYDLNCDRKDGDVL